MIQSAPWSTDKFNGMPYRFIGKSGLQASNIGLGTWKFGYPETGDDSRVDEKTALQIFDRAVETGVTFWDTANRYNNGTGNSEKIIGKWFKSNPDQRRNIVLATKVFGGMDGSTPNHSGLSRGNILDSVYACLKRLQLEYIDLLYFHAFDPVVPIEESLCAIEDLVKRDLVRYFAVSNFTTAQLSMYRLAEEKTSVRCKITAVQNQFDILNGESEKQKGVLEYAASSGISYIAWSPLARGLLTERYIDIANIGPGDRLYDEGSSDLYRDEVLRRKLAGLAELSAKWGIKLNQLALAYMLTLPGMGPLIPSSSTIEQLESNAAAGKLTLDEAQLGLIKNILR
ncbi:MAG TPA: aldo/keto reductase [Clostridiales bacterium]|nr:aldo/keto reductase [Clostridiales bacterium]